MGGYENSLPSHQIKVGDVVKVEMTSSSEGITGIVATVASSSITVAFKTEYPDDYKDGLRIIKLANDVSFTRMRYALDKLIEASQKGGHESLLKLIFEMKSAPVNLSLEYYSQVKLYNQQLNSIQKDAVIKTLALSPCALIFGPPGTGKTQTLVEIIKQIAKPTIPDQKPKRVLACAPSNLAVDNLVERLGQDPRFNILRLGHPARMLDTVIQHSLDYKIVNGDVNALIKDIRIEIDGLIKSLEKTKGAARREVYATLKDLRKELKQREKNALENMFRSTQIVLCTLNVSGSKQLNGQHFDIAIIDESSQALQAECWLPILLADKIIFAGDHQQLPPTVTSEEAASKGLNQTLFGKLIKKHPDLSSMLQIQYRMHEDIMKWTSDAMYEGKLLADKSVATHLLSDIVSNIAIDDPILMFDTAGLGLDEGIDDTGEVESKFNEGEAKIAINHATELVRSGLSYKHIAIITPYNGQVDLLKDLVELEPLLKGMEIGTVDSFQGREKEAVIITFVRSNSNREIGFLSDIRRTNVAITRARRHVCLIGDSDTLGRHPFYKNLVQRILIV